MSVGRNVFCMGQPPFLFLFRILIKKTSCSAATLVPLHMDRRANVPYCHIKKDHAQADHSASCCRPALLLASTLVAREEDRLACPAAIRRAKGRRASHSRLTPDSRSRNSDEVAQAEWRCYNSAH